MNKREKEELELHNLLQECIEEQLAIGLTPKDNIEIYFSKDPITGERPSPNTGAFAMIDDNGRPFIVMTRNYFQKMPINCIKGLIHHELIHLNLPKENKLIKHIRDWRKYTELSNKVYEKYKINPLETYSFECFETKNGIPKYNYIAKCPRCGLIVHDLLDENTEYDLDITCHNCGVKLKIEKKD